MKITVLMDNNALISRYFVSEPGFSLFIECEDIKILFDTGCTDAFIQNANRMRLNLLDIDYLVLSHGHLDHTWGLQPLMLKYTENKLMNKKMKPPTLIAHPFAFNQKYGQNNVIKGIYLQEEFIKSMFSVNLSKEPVWISDKLVFLGEIPRNIEFEAKYPIGTTKIGDSVIEDYVLDDSALAYISENGLVIITGCSHSGICNITEYAKKVTGIDKVSDIIGGFHLQNPDPEQLEGTKDYLATLNLRGLYPCHCTDLQSKIEIAKKMDIKEVGVGMRLEFE